MGDSLTQLQDCLDQLAAQMYASLNFINIHHENAPIRGQEWRAKWPNAKGTVDGTLETAFIDGTKPTSSSVPGTPAAGQSQSQGPSDLDPTLPSRPNSPNTFNAALQELCRDLVFKEQQIEYLIQSLPGIGSSQDEQEAKIKELEDELRTVEGEVLQATQHKARLVQRLDYVITRIRRV